MFDNEPLLLLYYHRSFEARVAQLVEHHLAKVAVAGSNPVSRSSLFLPKYRGVEQSVARRAHNPKVIGSSPVPATIYEARVAQLVEHHLAKVAVAGSNPVSRSIFPFRRYGQVVRHRSAKPCISSSNLDAASKLPKISS